MNMNSPSDEGNRMEAQEVSDHDDEDHDPQHVCPSSQQGWWCRRNPKWSVCVFCVVAIAVGTTVGLLLAIHLPYDQDEIYYPYRDLIQSFNLSTESSDETIRQAIDTMNEHYRTQCKGGSVLAVTRNGGQRVIVSQGVMTIGTNNTMDENTLFEIGSISKPFTGLVLANQITTGMLSLDTPLNDLLPSDTIPDLIVQGKLVTLRQLVTHTAGFPRESQYVRQLDPYDYDSLKDTTEETFLREIAIAANKGLGQSGTYEYSNFGFSILAYLLGKNATTPFPDLQKAMTDRLNMTNTYIETVPSDVALSRLSTGYIMPGSKPAPYLYDSGLFLNGAGSTVSSTTDLLQFVETLLATDVYSVYPNATVYDDTDTLLGQEQLQEALRLSLTPLNEFGDGGFAFAWSYGYFNKSTNADSINFVHSGSTFGFSTVAAFQPKSQTGVVGLTNCRTGDIQAMGFALALNLYQN